MFTNLTDWLQGNPWDIVLMIVGGILLSMVNESKQGRKGYFVTLGCILAICIYFATKYLFVGDGASSVPSGSSSSDPFSFPWGKFIGTTIIFAIFGTLTFMAARPWNVAPPQMKYPVDDKGSKELNKETIEDQAQRKREERYFHWPSIFGYAGMGLSLLIPIVFPKGLVILLGFILFPTFFWLVGNFKVPARRRWVLKYVGEFMDDRGDWKLQGSHIRTKCIRKFLLPNGDEDKEESKIWENRMKQNGFFMDGGWNRIPLLAIFLPLIEVEAVVYEKVETRFQTEQLPTMGQREDPRDRDRTGDNKVDPFSAAATLSLDTRVDLIMNELPFNFIFRTSSDRNDAVGVAARHIASINAEEMNTMHISEAMMYPFFVSSNMSRSGVVMTGTNVPSAIQVKVAHHMILGELDDSCMHHLGVGVTYYKVMDRNPDPKVQAKMNQLTESALDEEIGLRKGRAAGNEAKTEIQEIITSFGCTFQEATFYLINRDKARNASTQYVDGLQGFAAAAATLGGGSQAGRS